MSTSIHDRKFTCTICGTELTRDQIKCFYSANYGCLGCEREADRRYDAYVDPSGYYTAKAERDDPDG